MKTTVSAISGNANVTSAERQKKTIRKVADEIYELRVSAQESRMEKGDDEREIKTWTDSIDNELGTWDNEITKASKTVNTWKEQEDKQAKLHKEEIKAKARQDLFKEQIEFDQAKMKQGWSMSLKWTKFVRRKRETKRETTTDECEATETGDHKIQRNATRLVTVLEPIRSRDRQSGCCSAG